MFLFKLDAHVLIDFGSNKSFVSVTFASYVDRELSLLDCELVVQSPLGESVMRSVVYSGCIIKIRKWSLNYI